MRECQCCEPHKSAVSRLAVLRNLTRFVVSHSRHEKAHNQPVQAREERGRNYGMTCQCYRKTWEIIVTRVVRVVYASARFRSIATHGVHATTWAALDTCSWSASQHLRYRQTCPSPLNGCNIAFCLRPVNAEAPLVEKPPPRESTGCWINRESSVSESVNEITSEALLES